MNIPFSIAVYILFPLLIVYLCYKIPFLNKIGIVVLCYITGITLGNIGILPDNIQKVQESIAEITVVVAIPLLLFSLDIGKWSRLAGKTLISLVLAVVSISIVSTAGFFAIRTIESKPWEYTAMSIAVYTGGTPNLAAIRTALSIDSTRFIVVHTYDTVISIIFIVFCITVAQRFFLLYLPEFVKKNSDQSESQDLTSQEGIEQYSGLFSKNILPPLSGALLLSISVVGISVLLSSFIPDNYATIFIILAITTGGIAASLITKIRSIEKTFQLGMIIIYMFCFAVGSMARFDILADINYPIMILIFSAIFGTMAIHSLLCRIFKVDADTFIITSTSTICSPPFVPIVADALKNKEIILSGLTTGIIGYAIGNYLGISMAYLMKNFFY